MRAEVGNIDVHVETVSLSFDIESGGRELRPSPMGYVRDLKALIFHCWTKIRGFLNYSLNLNCTGLASKPGMT